MAAVWTRFLNDQKQKPFDYYSFSHTHSHTTLPQFNYARFLLSYSVFTLVSVAGMFSDGTARTRPENYNTDFVAFVQHAPRNSPSNASSVHGKNAPKTFKSWITALAWTVSIVPRTKRSAVESRRSSYRAQISFPVVSQIACRVDHVIFSISQPRYTNYESVVAL